MSIIRPFQAIRYATAAMPDISSRLAPPYDILSEEDKQALLARDPANFVKIDLPHTPPKSAGPPRAYQASRTTLDAWLSDSTMTRDSRPAIYTYHQLYHHGNTEYVRKMFFARLRQEPFGTGGVFPHERTFGGPKEDRLSLMKATAANLSPIFGLYEDADNEVAHLLEQALPAQPLAVGTQDGVENRLWAVTDEQVVARVARMIDPRPIYIADGHHRYETGLLYRKWLTEQRGRLPQDHPANFVLCCFCAMGDPGLQILPTHRVVPGVKATAKTFSDDTQIEVSRLEVDDPDQAVQALAPLGPQAVAFHNPAAPGYFALRPRSADILDAHEPQRSPAWRRLGLAFLHAYLLERVVTPRLCAGKEPRIKYVKAGPDAVTAAAETGGSAFLMQPTTMEELRAVCSAGDVMPQKSTYFYPKLASGLVINPLSD